MNQWTQSVHFDYWHEAYSRAVLRTSLPSLRPLVGLHHSCLREPDRPAVRIASTIARSRATPGARTAEERIGLPLHATFSAFDTTERKSAANLCYSRYSDYKPAIRAVNGSVAELPSCSVEPKHCPMVQGSATRSAVSIWCKPRRVTDWPEQTNGEDCTRTRRPRTPTSSTELLAVQHVAFPFEQPRRR
jgi:hypothetical protein